MHYRSLSGASMKALGALNQFSLLEGRADELRLSSDAVTIINAPANHPDKIEALNRVAFSPSLFAEVQEAYGSNIPSDANLKYFFVKKGIPSKSTLAAVKAFRETIEFLEREGTSPIREDELEKNGGEASNVRQELETENLENVGPSEQTIGNIFSPRTQMSAPHQTSGEEFKTRVGPETFARVFFEGPVTQIAIQKLIDYLEFSKDMYPLNVEDKD